MYFNYYLPNYKEKTKLYQNFEEKKLALTIQTLDEKEKYAIQ